MKRAASASTTPGRKASEDTIAALANLAKAPVLTFAFKEVPPDDLAPDTDLLTALARATVIAEEGKAAWAKGAALHWTARYCHEYVALLDQIASTPSVTLEGARAKATFALLDPDPRSRYFRIATSALAELLTFGGAV